VGPKMILDIRMIAINARVYDRDEHTVALCPQLQRLKIAHQLLRQVSGFDLPGSRMIAGKANHRAPKNVDRRRDKRIERGAQHIRIFCELLAKFGFLLLLRCPESIEISAIDSLDR